MRLGRADPHCHTVASDGMATPAELVKGALRRGLSLIAITDHDTMASVAEVVARGEEAGVAVVPGQEITTRWPAQTHLLGWFLDRPIPIGLSLSDSVDAVHAQGGLAVIPHPFMPTYFASCQPGMLERLIETHRLDGIELIHTAPTTAGRDRALQRFYHRNQERLGAGLGASDSHFGFHDLGRALTLFEGTTAGDFRRAVEGRATRAQTGSRSPVPPLLVARQQVRSLVELPIRRLRGQLQ